jgi:hypothetical protein
MGFNITEHIGEDGSFKETFAPSVIETLGPDYKDSKALEGITDSVGLTKAYIDTKKLVGQKLEGVIKKPGEKATEAEKAEYHKSLLKELGTPEKPEDYVFDRPEKLPDGMVYDENFETAFRQVFAEIDLPASMATALSKKFNELQTANFQAYMEQQENVFKEDVASLDKDWPGDKGSLNNRAALAALNEFGTPELKKLIADAKLSEAGNINNHALWRKSGLSPTQRRVWAAIGTRMKSPTIADQGTPEQPASDQRVYNHPTSSELYKSKS